MILTNNFGFAILDFGLGDNDVNEEEFKKRTKQLALRTIKLVAELLDQSKIENPKSKIIPEVLGKQLLRSSTSVGANYRAVCRAKSAADMINKLRIVEEEADESGYWLELIGESELVKPERLTELINEFDEIVAMVVASQKTLRANNPQSKIEAPESGMHNPKSKIENPK